LLSQPMPPKQEADMELYAAIDLHSNNSVVVVTDASDHVVLAKRFRNDLEAIVTALRSCAGEVRAVAVESTYNWYWLVDGLRSAGFDVRLVNTAAVEQYDGLKHGDDFSDGKHLAQLLRLGILVNSRRESNGKSKGIGNRKCGNKHLSWAFIEAAHHAVRYDPSIRRFYERRRAKTLAVVAIKAVAHKLARACYYIMRDGVPYDGARAFA